MSNAHDRYLGALPDDWPKKELGQICTQIVSGGTPSRSNSACWRGSIPWVTPGELTNLRTKYLSSTDERITDLGLASSGATLVPSDSLLVTTRATLGSVALAAMPLATNQGFKTAMFGPDVDASFGYHLFHRLKPELTRRSSGTTFLEISGSQFKQIVVPVPPSPEQRRIAEILDTVDEAIRSTETLIAKLERMKQGLLHDLLTRGIDDNGALRDPIRNPDQFHTTDLGLLPITWNATPLGNLLAKVDPSMRSGPFGSALLKAELVSEGVPMLGIDNVNVEQFVPTFSRFVTPKKFHELSRYAVRPNDIMITIMGTVGRCCEVPSDIGDALSSKHVWTLTIDQAVYLPFLACLQINYSDWVLRHFSRDTQGGIMSAIRSETLRSVLLPTPPIREQVKMASVLSTENRRLASLRAELAKLRLLKVGLMDDLLTGHVRVTVGGGDAI